MKGFNILLIVFLLITGCKQQPDQQKNAEEVPDDAKMAVFGQEFDPEMARNSNEMFAEFNKLQPSDTLNVAFYGTVTDVCKAKGCWVKVSLADGEEAIVTFKDYGFFVPKDIVGKEIVLSGQSYIEEMSVEDQRHFAKDGGASEEELNQITTPKVTYSFIADGVLVKG